MARLAREQEVMAEQLAKQYQQAKVGKPDTKPGGDVQNTLRVTLPKDFKFTTLSEATEIIEDVDRKGVYKADLRRDWTIGIVPHGGYLTSLLMTATSKYMSTHHASLNQPHPMATHLEFPGKSDPGPATVTVSPVKLGRTLSLLSVKLEQGEQLRITGFITHANIAEEKGESFSVEGWNESTLNIPRREDCTIVDGKEEPLAHLRMAQGKMQYGYQKGLPFGSAGDGVRCQWVKWSTGGNGKEGFNVQSLGYVSDMFIPLVETHPARTGNGVNWYPTVNLNLEVKSVPPPGGWEWLFVELRANVIKNGRMDMRVVIRDENGQIVAIGGQVALVVSIQRNLSRASKL